MPSNNIKLKTIEKDISYLEANPFYLDYASLDKLENILVQRWSTEDLEKFQKKVEKQLLDIRVMELVEAALNQHLNKFEHEYSTD